MVGPASRALLIGVTLAALASPAVAQEFAVTAHCRDGQPHGAYELHGPNGVLRVAGAFNRGKRTSSFIFWTSGGVRVAHIPYDEDRLSGTLSLWYSEARPGRDPQQKLQSVYTEGRRNGTTRSWYPNGRERAVFQYDNGDLVEAKSWDASGATQSEREARSRAARDRDEDERYYASLDAMVTTHLPRCDNAAPVQKADTSDRLSESTAGRSHALANSP